MRTYLIALSILLGFVLPSTAQEPFPGFADRLVMACGATGVTNVFFREDGEIISYAHTPRGKKLLMEMCLHREYARIAKAQFPVDVSREATRITIRKNGTIVLH